MDWNSGGTNGAAATVLAGVEVGIIAESRFVVVGDFLFVVVVLNRLNLVVVAVIVVLEVVNLVVVAVVVVLEVVNLVVIVA